MPMYCPECGDTMTHERAAHTAPCPSCARPMALPRRPADEAPPPPPAAPGPTYWTFSALAILILLGICLGILMPNLAAATMVWLRGGSWEDAQNLPLVTPWKVLLTLAALALAGSHARARRAR